LRDLDPSFLFELARPLPERSLADAIDEVAAGSKAIEYFEFSEETVISEEGVYRELLELATKAGLPVVLLLERLD